MIFISTGAVRKDYLVPRNEGIMNAVPLTQTIWRSSHDPRRSHDVLFLRTGGLGAFLRDKLQFPFTDVGDGWLIFDLPEADMGCHPADAAEGVPSGTHDISFYRDDIAKTVADLKARGVEFTAPVADHGYGLVTHFKMPGGFAVQLYQPKYAKQKPK